MSEKSAINVLLNALRKSGKNPMTTLEPILSRILKDFRPQNAEEASKLCAILLSAASKVNAMNNFYHIEDHEGYQCAREGSAVVSQTFLAMTLEDTDEILRLLNRKTLSEHFDYNKQVRDEILREMQEEKGEKRGT